MLVLSGGAIVQGQVFFPLSATGYDSHAELNWTTPAGTSPVSYKIFRSTSAGAFSELKNTSKTQALDFTGFPGSQPIAYSYFLQALDGAGTVIAVSDTVGVTVQASSDEALLDMVQRYTFRYFWDFGHPVSGMARERNSSGDIVTTGGTGFGIMGILVGIERGFITRQEGLNRLLQITSFLQFADRFHGVFPHWMNGVTGNVVPFSQFDNGGDLVETAFLMQGLLCARQYFNQNDPVEEALRDVITGLWEDVEWDFYRKNNGGVLYWHWSPNYQWQMNFQIRGYNEALIIYLLAVASPTHGVPASLWNTGWTASGYANSNAWYGYPIFTGPSFGGPLFFAHYSFLGFDPRNKKDAFANYFLRNRNHTLINRAYCINNQLNFEGYGENCWGLTASDNPWGYYAHQPGGSNDNGTIAPTAALSSMPYTPGESIAALKHFYREHGAQLWGDMGFFDAFNLEHNWFADSYLAIDQGPILCMIENYRSGLLWDLFMANPEIQPALDAIGFVEDILPAGETGLAVMAWEVYPNPTCGEISVALFADAPKTVSLSLLDARGQLVRRVFENEKLQAGQVQIPLTIGDLPPGLYWVRLESEAGTSVRKVLKF